MLTIDDLAVGYDTVIVAGADVYGRLFGRRIPLRRFLTEPGAPVEICVAALVWDITQDLGIKVDFGGYHTGWHDFKLQPDLSSLRRYPGVSGTAICMADINDEEGRPVTIAPRNILRGQIARAMARGLHVVLATELEFYLFHDGPRDLRLRGFRDLRPTTVVGSAYSIAGQALQEPFMARVRRAMDDADIAIYSCQAELGRGQWEINFEHTGALEMADRHAIYKTGLKEIALQEGMTPTFMARPIADDVGSSCHVHCSVSGDGRALFAAGDTSTELSPIGRRWVAGQLVHLDELALFFAPYVNSYKRHPADDAAGGIRAWGADNRMVALRVVGSGSSLRMEHRYPGADVNPYLAAAGIIAAGLDGLDQELDPGTPITGDARAAADLPRPPQSVGAAAAAFKASAFVAEAFGPEVVAHYVAHAEAEWSGYLKAVTDWEIRRAFELA